MPRFAALAAALCAHMSTTASAGSVLEDVLGAPAWLSISGESRARYETLDGQFRVGGGGGDQALFFRTLLAVEADVGSAAFGFELQDSRGYLTDSGTPLTSSFVNPVDFLQAYVRIDAPGLLGAGSRTDLILGRQTVSIGSKRQIERVSYANVIRAFTGAHAISTNERGDALHLVLAAPVSRSPTARERVERNGLEFDREEFGRRIWAAHYRRADAAPSIASDLWLEAFVYGLHEKDTARTPTPNRRYVAPGFRVFRAPSLGAWDIDLEASFRFGARRASSAADDVADLDVAALALLARAGYTFDAPWRPRVALQYYLATGDDDPNDDRFDQYERLFGARRTDLNNTSIHGPLTPANLSAPGVRLNVDPTPNVDARLHYSAAFLASGSDVFAIARLRDETGASGRFLGHTIDTRLRRRFRDRGLIFELGASAFVFGEFTRSAQGAPAGRRTLFGYAQATLTF